MRQVMLWQCKCLQAGTSAEHTEVQEVEIQELSNGQAITRCMIPILDTKSKGAYLGLSFMCLGPRLRLRLEVLVLCVTLASAVLAQAPSAEKQVLDVAVTNVTRESPRLVRIEYVFTNKGGVDLYFPYVQIAESAVVTSLSLLHRIGENAWVNIGLRFDIASYRPIILHPGGSQRLVLEVSDPSDVLLQGAGDIPTRQSIALHGTNKIKVEYYSGRAEWELRLAAIKKQQQSRSLVAQPKSEVVYSAPFEIP